METAKRRSVPAGGYPKQRESNIELFRIITMILIIAHHYVVNSGLTGTDGPIYADPLSWRSIFLLVLGAWGKIGINCFFEVMFYRVAFAVVFLIAGYLSIMDFIKAFIPIRNIGNGFISAFLMFYLLIPFLNILIHNMTEKQHLLLLLWTGFTYVFLGTVPFMSVTMNYVSWFSVLFIIASYLRLYPKPCFSKATMWGWLTLLCVVLDVISVLACIWLGSRLDRNMAYTFVTDST